MKRIVFLLGVLISFHAYSSWAPFGPEGIHANKIEFVIDNNANWAICHDQGLYLYDLVNQNWTDHPTTLPVLGAAYLDGTKILVIMGDGSFSDGIYAYNPATEEYEPELFFKDTQYSVLDYEVDSSRVYMVIFRYRLGESELLCMSASGDTASCSGKLPFRPKRLFHDCLGHIHVLSNDTAYQVFRDSSILRLIYPVEIDRFRKTLSDCVASSGDLLFFRKTDRTNLGVEFYHINKKTSQRKHLTNANDEAKMKMLRRNSDDNAFLMMSSIPDGREAFQQWSWVKKVLYKPNTSTLHKINDVLCVFNTADYTLELYTLQGEFTSKLKLQVQNTNAGRWTTEIYIDDIDQKAYTSFLKNGKMTLYRIDLNNGDLKRITTSRHMYPQKVKVHNNFLFYLYDLPGEGDNKHMFRQKL